MKNKICFLLLFVFIILFLLYNSSFAFDVTDNTGNSTKTYHFPDLPSEYSSYLQEYDYFIYYHIYNNVTYYHIFFLDNSSFAYIYDDPYSDTDYIKTSGSILHVFTTSSDGVNFSDWSYSGTSSASAYLSRSIYYNTDIYTDENKTGLYFDLTPAVYPSILDSDDNLSTLNVDNIVVDSGNISIMEGFFDLVISTAPDDFSEFTTVYSVKLTSDSPYYRSGGLNGDYYVIPTSSFKYLLTSGYSVQYTLLWFEEGMEMSASTSWIATYSPDGSDVVDIGDKIDTGFSFLGSKLENAITVLQNSQSSEKEDNKNIIESLKAVVSFLNPLSDNFFVYKLIDLLIDALISLFVPSSEFFANWIADLNNYFSDRFGMLYYPFELAINVLNRVSNVSSHINGNFIISFPDLKLMGTTLIPSFSYDFSTLLENETFSYIYDIYLTFIDFILISCLLVLCKNTFVEIFGGRFADEVASAVNADEVAYNRVVRKHNAYSKMYHDRK